MSSASSNPASDADKGAISPIQAVLRRKWSILAFATAAAAAMALYSSTIPTSYTSEVALSVDARQLRVINAEALLTNRLLDREQLRTEMEPLSSIRLARDVVTKLSLNTNPEFCGEPEKVSLLALLHPRAHLKQVDAPCSMPVDAAARMLLSKINPHTDSVSYVIQIAATAGSPALAASIANAYAEAFISDRRLDAANVSAKAGVWLTTYAEKLRNDLAQADAALASYEAAHGLTQLRGGTLTSQTLIDLNTAFTQLTSEIAQKRAIVDQLQSAHRAQGSIPQNAQLGSAPLLQSLLSREAELAEQEDKLRTQFGDLHPDVVSAEAQVSRLKQQVAREIGKSVAGANSDLSALVGRSTSLQQQIESLKAQVGVQQRADVQLQALQREAESKRQTYQSIVNRRLELQAQQGMQQADARVAAEALPPTSPSAPHRSMLVAGAFLAACGIGAGIAFPVELLSRRFRDAEHVEEEVGLSILGMFPRPPSGVQPHDVTTACLGSPEAEAVLRILPSFLSRGAAPRTTLPKVIALTSSLPGEGKSSLSVALARAAAQLGVRVILVDCDLRRPTTERLMTSALNMAIGSSLTQINALTIEPMLPGSLSADKQSPLHYTSLARAMPDRPRFVTQQDVQVLVNALSSRYDLIMLDAPPLLVLADALTIATCADAVILAVDWRTTPRRAMSAAVQILQRQGATILGAVTTKVDLRKDGRSRSHYFHYDKKYFQSESAQAGA